MICFKLSGFFGKRFLVLFLEYYFEIQRDLKYGFDFIEYFVCD